MPDFLYRIQPTRPGLLLQGPTEQESAIVEAHLLYLKNLVSDGVVLMAGRTLTADASAFGIVVFRADSEPEAREIMRKDPAVAQGVMSAELFPYRIALWSSQGPGDSR